MLRRRPTVGIVVAGCSRVARRAVIGVGDGGDGGRCRGGGGHVAAWTAGSASSSACSRSVRSGRRAHLLDRHRSRPNGRAWTPSSTTWRRSQTGQRLRRLPSGRLPPRRETVANASIKLHGQSSWLQTVMFDGERAKMQFDVAFDKVDANRQVSRPRQAGLRHAALRLDVPARPARARVAAAEPGSWPAARPARA